MFTSVCTFILIIQLWESANTYELSKLYGILKPLHKKDTLFQSPSNSKNAPNNENFEYPQEAKLFENIREVSETISPNPFTLTTLTNTDETLNELKTILLKMLCKLDNMEENCSKGSKQRNIRTTNNHIVTIKEVTEAIVKKEKNDQNVKRRSRWGSWTQWSSCSVTCGKGREIRWRHCLEQCDTAETEMEEKSCQLPACAPKHMFGFP